MTPEYQEIKPYVIRRVSQAKWEAIVKILANEVFGYNGSSKTSPPMTGVVWATVTLKETIAFLLAQHHQLLLDQVGKLKHKFVGKPYEIDKKGVSYYHGADWDDGFVTAINHVLFAIREEGGRK